MQLSFVLHDYFVMAVSGKGDKKGKQQISVEV